MHPLAVLTRLLTVTIALIATAPAAAAQNPPPGADAVLAAAPKATWIADGNGRRIVYIFFDPNCPSCQTLYQNLRPFLASHALQLRWIPVAVVNPTSAGKAAAILEAPDPTAAFRRNEEHYDTGSYAGAIEEQIPSPETERKLRANERLLNRLTIPVVPSMLFADKDRHTVLIQGALSPVALRKVFTRLP